MLRILGGVIGTLILASVALWTAPRWLAPHIAARAPGCVYTIPTQERAIALTIDDGPDSASTPEILGVLSEHGAHATFFLISSRVMGREPVVSAIVAQGHEIGNHTTREERSLHLSREAFAAGVDEAGTVLNRFAPVRWLRPGAGLYSAEMIATIERAGYRCALGSIYPYDPQLRSAAIASAYILANARPGAIVILHDWGARGPRTAETLRRALPVLRARGYRVLTLSELERLKS